MLGASRGDKFWQAGKYGHSDAKPSNGVPKQI
jgi:hypothetical protein